MASAKRKIYKEETEESGKKKKKAAETERMDEDRLSDLPEELQLRILGYLDTKEAVQTAKLSRRWVSLWTRIPILEINHFSFHYSVNFHKFVNEVLSRRDPLAKLDHLKLNNNFGNAKILKSVFEYAFSHGVKHLEASTECPITIDSWPVCQCDSLTSLELQSKDRWLRCPFLGRRQRRCILFKNLTVLYLERALITDLEPFSGFQGLESLTLITCRYIRPNVMWVDESKTLKVHALRLSDLTILNFRGACLELNTPRLRFLKYHGPKLLKHKGGLPVLETLEINFYGLYFNRGKEREKRVIDELMSLFSTLPPNIKSLTLFSGTVILLSLFPDELVRRGSPFRDLKDLKLDFSRYNFRPVSLHKPCNGWYNSVIAYLLHSSPHAEFTLTYPKDIDDMKSSDEEFKVACSLYNDSKWPM